jgi:YrbI family 3-deoxy-D-manno-octulosonate 8-phosphate phosphatase
MSQDERCGAIELVLSDVDGVLTDGGIVYDNQGIETKRFHIRDGMGVKLWQRAGFRFGIVTARSSQVVRLRASELGIDLLRQACDDKLMAVKQVLSDLQLSPDRACYIGDDLPDLPVMRHVGWPVAVADAAAELHTIAAYVTRNPGGRGAVRETLEVLLKAKGMWDDLIRRYTGQ